MSKTQQYWLRGKAILAVTLVLMALMRLIWIQLRSYPPLLEGRTRVAIESLPLQGHSHCYIAPPLVENSLDVPLTQEQRKWLISPGFAHLVDYACRGGRFQPRTFVTLNQNMLAFIVFLCVVASRFLTGGWMMPLIISVTLLSRGRLITQIGDISSQYLTTTVFTMFTVCLIHYVRTGWIPAMLIFVAVGALLAMTEPALAPLVLILPFLHFYWRMIQSRPITDFQPSSPDPNKQKGFGLLLKLGYKIGIHRFPEFGKGREDQIGRALSPLLMPVSTWVLYRKRWLKFGAISLAAALFMQYICLGSLNYPGFLLNHLDQLNIRFLNSALVNAWFDGFLSPLDVDLAVAFIVLFIGLLSPKSKALPGYIDICTSLLLLLLLTILTTFIFDSLEFSYLQALGVESGWTLGYRAPMILHWFEPIIITAGILGILNIINIFDTLFLKNKNDS